MELLAKNIRWPFIDARVSSSQPIPIVDNNVTYKKLEVLRMLIRHQGEEAQIYLISIHQASVSVLCDGKGVLSEIRYAEIRKNARLFVQAKSNYKRQSFFHKIPQTKDPTVLEADTSEKIASVYLVNSST